MRQFSELQFPIPLQGAPDSFFISANGYGGFRSHHTSFYESTQFTHTFVLKGGPGTGKSYTLRKAAEQAKQQGAHCRYIYCSSDPGSLDGVILEKGDCRIAVLDGTAPHERDAVIPGAFDEIINLGAYWNTESLMKQRDIIASLTKKKAHAYQKAYRQLGVAGQLALEVEKEITTCLRMDKMQKNITKEIRELHPSKNPGEEIRYRSAFSMRGTARFAPPETATLLCLKDCFGTAGIYLSVFRKMLQKSSRFHYLCYPSVYTERIVESIYLPDNNLMILQDEDAVGRQINMHRFLDTGELARKRPYMRLGERLSNEMKVCALASLQEAATYHFALEEIYGESMNFKEKEHCTATLCEKISKMLK